MGAESPPPVPQEPKKPGLDRITTLYKTYAYN